MAYTDLSFGQKGVWARAKEGFDDAATGEIGATVEGGIGIQTNSMSIYGFFF